MTKDQIKTGNDLYKYVLQLLEQKDKETQVLRENNPLYSIKGDAITAYPTLLNYLLSLWATAEKYKNVEKVTFSLIAKILQEAFATPPKKVNWDELLKEQFIMPYTSEANSQEYFIEIRKFEYFEKSMRNDVVSLKMLNTYGAEKLGVKMHDNIFTGNQYFWKNHTTETFLERGTAFLEDEMEDGSDPKYPVSWFDLEAILNNGRFEE
ncbi:hypothetical protein B0A58_08730 [Flavobacterium branchiophilum NBRC 15030 = ATCC 35035]|uniref:Uncharacterized protein n=2 Tax=Flavobacterium branchiophilum TaxID=55197 RepID=A0A543G2E3_9FLAO|nr:hypothetical protein [Flavobacterium branchiophilum]OXA75455.1 hypothetical protein B0A58_08730 [Flavobacterium branchiophilum NBRC 15030 = ATCC 35035]TQM40205.1 hypothetical protein BC670_1079 [Flavobacterium branchiophilum]GEM55826.1 hypothetical protein FB1_20470 [Flavobacterium branchiophilum NBRC 15030 = ATCC 35035]